MEQMLEMRLDMHQIHEEGSGEDRKQEEHLDGNVDVGRRHRLQGWTGWWWPHRPVTWRGSYSLLDGSVVKLLMGLVTGWKQNMGTIGMVPVWWHVRSSGQLLSENYQRGLNGAFLWQPHTVFNTVNSSIITWTVPFQRKRTTGPW